MNLTTRKVVQAFGFYPAPSVSIDGDTQEVRVCCLACRHETARFGMATPVVYGDVALDCADCGEQLVRWRVF